MKIEQIGEAFIKDVLGNKALPVAKAADVFPMIGDEDYEAMRKDIASTRKVINPIAITTGGELIDGRNRLKALRSLGFVWGEVRKVSDTDAMVYFYDRPLEGIMKMVTCSVPLRMVGSEAAGEAWRSNILRRHLEPSQRAGILVLLYPKMDVAERMERARAVKGGSSISPNGELEQTDALLAADAGIGTTTLHRARADQALDPAIVEATVSGDKKKAAALRKAAKEKAEQAKPRKPAKRKQEDDSSDSSDSAAPVPVASADDRILMAISILDEAMRARIVLEAIKGMGKEVRRKLIEELSK